MPLMRDIYRRLRAAARQMHKSIADFIGRRHKQKVVDAWAKMLGLKLVVPAHHAIGIGHWMLVSADDRKAWVFVKQLDANGPHFGRSDDALCMATGIDGIFEAICKMHSLSIWHIDLDISSPFSKWNVCYEDLAEREVLNPLHGCKTYEEAMMMLDLCEV